MVYTERAEMAAVSCGTSHASAVSTPLRWIFKNALRKANHSCRITCERSESAGERSVALYKSDQQQQQQQLFTSCARLNLGRLVGSFGFIYKVCYFQFNGVMWTVSLDLSHCLSACRCSRFSSQNCSAILLNQGVSFLVRTVQWQRGAYLSRTEQRWLL